MPYEEDYKMWLEKMLIESNPDWVCDGMYDVGLTHEWCEKYCGEDSEYVTPKCLHMFYHHIARADRNSSENPNNCEHITEDGVTCAKYPACDDCLDNPLNKVKGSERLLKGKDEPSADKLSAVEDEPKTEDLQDWKDRMWAEAIVTEPTGDNLSAVEDDAYFLELMGAVERGEISDAGANQAWYEYINHKDEPMKTADYCDICKRDMCEFCVADATNPYCVPSHYEINYEPKDEPQYDAEEVAKDINRRVEMGKKEWNARHIEDEPQTDCDRYVITNDEGDKVYGCIGCTQTDCAWK